MLTREHHNFDIFRCSLCLDLCLVRPGWKKRHILGTSARPHGHHTIRVFFKYSFPLVVFQPFTRAPTPF